MSRVPVMSSRQLDHCVDTRSHGHLFDPVALFVGAHDGEPDGRVLDLEWGVSNQGGGCLRRSHVLSLPLYVTDAEVRGLPRV